MTMMFALSVKTETMAKLANQKTFDLKRMYVCLIKIGKLYHLSRHSNCQATLDLFLKLRDMLEIQSFLNAQIKHLELRIKQNNVSLAQLDQVKELHHFQFRLTNPISYIFFDILMKFEKVMQLLELSSISGVFKKRRVIMDKQNKCLSRVTKLMGNLSNVQKTEIDAFKNTVLDKSQKGLLRLALNHSAMPDYIEKARAYYQMKLKEAAVVATEELTTTI